MAQLDVWATGQVDLAAWDRSFREHDTVVAVEDGCIVGAADMDTVGYLDRLHVHKDHQGEGIATALCDQPEGVHRASFTTLASINARSFFEKRGYRVLQELQEERGELGLTNFVMEKAKNALWEEISTGLFLLLRS